MATGFGLMKEFHREGAKGAKWECLCGLGAFAVAGFSAVAKLTRFAARPSVTRKF